MICICGYIICRSAEPFLRSVYHTCLTQLRTLIPFTKIQRTAPSWSGYVKRSLVLLHTDGMDEIDHNPLSKIYQQRIIESHLVFKQSLNPDETLKELSQPNAHPPTSLEYHTTPTTQLLKEWRDSCRDVLCHLYCYATTSSSCTNGLVDTLQKMKVSRIIELGAGNRLHGKVTAAYHCSGI
jgi:hypothetical protein